jgi:hypothetical protein
MMLWQVVLTLIAIGFALWLVNRYIPMETRIKGLLNIVTLVVVVWWLFSIFGIWTFLTSHNKPIPQAGRGCNIGMVGR